MLAVTSVKALIRPQDCAGFGVPHQRRRMLFLASMHGDVRDLLLATGMRPCTGGDGSAFCEIKNLQNAASGVDARRCARPAAGSRRAPLHWMNNISMEALVYRGSDFSSSQVNDLLLATAVNAFPLGTTPMQHAAE